MSVSFDIGEKKFKLGKMDAMKQYHVARRLAPFIAELLPSLNKLKNQDASLSEEQKFAEISKALGPVADVLSKMTDSDSEYVLLRLLATVEVHQPQFNSWAKVAAETGIMMQDIELPILLQVAGRALMHNIGSFLASQRPK